MRHLIHSIHRELTLIFFTRLSSHKLLIFLNQKNTLTNMHKKEQSLLRIPKPTLSLSLSVVA